MTSSGLEGRLTRTKVSGPDKRHNFRLLVVHPSAFIHQKDWLVTGWRLLEKEAPHLRDYLVPAPTNNFRGFKREELSYQTAFAVQSQIVSLASYRGLRIFQMSTGHNYTPQSGRNFMPSATSVLNFARSERDMLGGWAAEGSDRYSRAAKYKIDLMQKTVSKTFQSTEHDPLAEADDLHALGTFLKSCDISDEEILRTKTLLVSRTFLDVPREDYSDSAAATVNLIPGEHIADESLDETLAARVKSRRRSNKSGTVAVQSYWVATTSRLVPTSEPTRSQDITYRILARRRSKSCTGWDKRAPRFSDASSYETVCKWCAKSKDFHSDPDSSCSNTSSSNEEEKRTRGSIWTPEIAVPFGRCDFH